MSSVAFSPLHAKPAFAPGGGSALRAHIESSLGERLASSLLLRERVAPLTVLTGIPVLDSLTGGLPRGALTEISGTASSGRTGVMLAALARATRKQEVCALVDASDSFDPTSAAAAGVDLERLLWVRCNSRLSSAPRPKTGSGFAYGGVLEQVLKVTDLLLQAGGFGMVVLDLGDIPVESVRKVPLTSWFRFRRAVEPTSTVLLLIEHEACAKTCASLVLRLRADAICASDCTGSSQVRLQPAAKEAGQVVQFSSASPAGLFREDSEQDFPASRDCPSCSPEERAGTHPALFRGMRFHAEMVRSWAQRKPPQSAGTSFELPVAL